VASAEELAMAIHAGKEREEREFSSFAPCVNSCIGVPSMKTRDVVLAADCDPRLISANHED
jgi:hypothetical protein